MAMIMQTQGYEDDSQRSFESEPTSLAERSESSSAEVTRVDELKQMEDFAAAETKRVRLFRSIVALSILCLGAAISTLTYISLQSQVKSDSQDAFQLFANTVEDNYNFRIQGIFAANRALSRAITTSSSSMGGEFPHFSVPAFESHAFDARQLAGFEAITYAPIAIRIDQWLSFANRTRGWLDESKDIFDKLQSGLNRSSEPTTPPLDNILWKYDETLRLVPRTQQGLIVPSLHTSPPPALDSQHYQNVDMFSDEAFKAASLAAVQLKDAVFSRFDRRYVDLATELLGDDYHLSLHLGGTPGYQTPHSLAVQPVYKGLGQEANDVVGYIYGILSWDNYLQSLLPDGVVGVIVVLRNSCDQAVTFELRGRRTVYIGDGDLHDDLYDSWRRTIAFSDNYFDPELTSKVSGHCQIFLDVYPSETFEKSYESSLPSTFSGTVACLFIFVAVAFFAYDRQVRFRNKKVVGAAARSNALVSSLFPSNVRDRLLAEQDDKEEVNKNPLEMFLTGETTQGSNSTDIFCTAPIADFFPNTTVLFADIVGFTAWSSVREPTQVFQLLESVYHAFDVIAAKRKIFKVETVGDCYVAVSGLPEPRKDHAVAMARFARECMQRMWSVTKQLEVTLGPDTADLTMRMGMHSGPVTAGVLRGERSRFQLFGDTMNTASRMESNGASNSIHISTETADLLEAAGRGSWCRLREEMINAKGKGALQTYWLYCGEKSDSRASGSSESGSNEREVSQIYGGKGEDDASVLLNAFPRSSGKTTRLVDWNVEILRNLLGDIMARRASNKPEPIDTLKSTWALAVEAHSSVLEEVQEIIELPHFDSRTRTKKKSLDVDPIVVTQLRQYVTNISVLYKDNPFHNFEHASHVTMSVVKLMKRIVAPSEHDLTDPQTKVNALALHDHTYGITSDPLTQFACVFSALIHDVDHPGVPNCQLVEEGSKLSEVYNGKSVAEQNSVDIAWSLLQTDDFRELRNAIYATRSETRRFRQLVVNSVMATDVMDQGLKALRNIRWEKAFHGECGLDEESQVVTNRKATIVIEHLIQASDVSHTMQHWHVYRKWNERLFMEMRKAYLEGRAPNDPADNWYQGELGFLDFYVIPLAKKLKECGVFGVSSDEYLNYAEANRAEWASKGKNVVEEMRRQEAGS